MTLVEITHLFSTEKRCREFLRRLRWPNGVECPRCKGKDIARLEGYDKFWCSECDYQFSVTVGTVFQDSHLPLEKWFIATYLMCESRKGISANQIKRTLGVSYKTAWFLCHRIRHAMKEAAAKKLSGTIEVDDTYIGGRAPGWEGRGARNKQIVIGIRDRGGELRFERVKDLTAKAIERAVGKHVGKNAELIITDEFPSYRYALARRPHRRIKHRETYVVGKIHTNTVESAFSLLKRGVIGTWHKISAKHLPAYLDEMTFRFNRRKNGDLFTETLRHMVTAPTLTFEKLTA